MTIEKITTFKTSDGLEWNVLQEAEHHQAKLDFDKFFEDTLGTNVNVNTSDVAASVWRHREIVKGILARALPPSDNEKLSV